MRKVALDANLLVLLAVGLVSRDSILRHKRLRAYSPDDFDLLRELIGPANRIVATPNSITEASNIAGYGLHEELRAHVYRRLGAIIEALDERYEPSSLVIKEPEYTRLGISDCAWLRCLEISTPLLTVDVELYVAALHRKLTALNFNHYREQRGTV